MQFCRSNTVLFLLHFVVIVIFYSGCLQKKNTNVRHKNDKPFKIVLIGTGTPTLEVGRNTTSTLIHAGQNKMLVDIGRGTISGLLNAGYSPLEIDALFITHFHFDHISELGDLLLTSWHNRRTSPLSIYGPPGTAEIIDNLVRGVYAHDLFFARQALSNIRPIEALVRVREIDQGLILHTKNLKVFAASVIHGHGLGELTQENWPCRGYRFEFEGKIAALSGDSVRCPGLNQLAQNADLLIQCAYWSSEELKDKKRVHAAQHIIASAEQAATIARDSRVRQLVLTHVRPKSEVMLEQMLREVQQIFSGTVVLAEDQMVLYP